MKKLIALFAISTFVLTACGITFDEKQAYIDATIEATCLIADSGDLFAEGLEDKMKAVYEKHGFDTSDQAALEALVTKYQDDETIVVAIEAGTKDCIAKVLEGLGDSFASVTNSATDSATAAIDAAFEESKANFEALDAEEVEESEVVEEEEVTASVTE